MPNDAAKVIDMASKISAMAEGSLAGLERVMAGWPAEFQAILWEAVAHTATLRAHAAHLASARHAEGSAASRTSPAGMGSIAHHAQ